MSSMSIARCAAVINVNKKQRSANYKEGKTRPCHEQHVSEHFILWLNAYNTIQCIAVGMKHQECDVFQVRPDTLINAMPSLETQLNPTI